MTERLVQQAPKPDPGLDEAVANRLPVGLYVEPVDIDGALWLPLVQALVLFAVPASGVGADAVGASLIAIMVVRGPVDLPRT